MLKSLSSKKPAFFFFLFFAFISTASSGQWNGDTLYGGKMSIRGQNVYHKSFAFEDGFGGIIEAYNLSDENAPYPSNYTISLQRTDSSGFLLWGGADSGNIVIRNNADRGMPLLIDAKPDYSGGAYILYNYPPASLNEDSFCLYLQHINPNGIPDWPGNGILLVQKESAYEDYYGKLTPDSINGVFAMWGSGNARNRKLYVQKVRSDGTKIWGESGINVCNYPGQYSNYFITRDGTGGLLSIFMDGRNATYNSTFNTYSRYELYAQHVNSAGVKNWGSEGILAAAMTGDSTIIIGPSETQSKLILSDGEGGCYFVYQKLSGPYNSQSYIQRLTSEGFKPWGDYGIQPNKLADGQLLFIDRIHKKQDGGVAALFSNRDNLTDSGMNISLWIQYLNSNGVALYSYPKKACITYNSFQSTGVISDARFHIDGSASIFFIGDSTLNIPKYQKVLSDGTLLWDSVGKTVIRQKADRIQLIPGNNDKTLLRWCDARNYPVANDRNDMFLTQVDSNGELPAARATAISLSNGNWNAPSTWLNNIIPGPDDIVVISHTVNVTVNTTCYALSVEPGGNIVVATGINLTILH